MEGKIVLNQFKSNPIQQALQDMGRFRHIVAILIKYGFGQIIHKMNLQDNFIARLLADKEELEEDSTTAQRLVKACQELGPSFIKLGQILSTRPDLIPEDFIVEFKKLQSGASPLPFEVIRDAIEEDLGQPLMDCFGSFEEKPLASASIAQVHRATLKDQTEVVLKVRRPGIKESLLSDLSILIFMAKRVESLFPDTAIFDPVGIATEFEKSLSKELDFKVEKKNLERAAKNFSNNPDVHIPLVFSEFSTESILVMEEIKGIKITEIQENKKETVRNLLRAIFEMIYFHGFFHGDLHPGNILIEKDGKIALIDFGLTGRLTSKMQGYITDLLMGLIQKDYDLVTETLFDIGKKKVPIHYDQFHADVSDVIDEHLIGVKLANVEFGLLLQDILDGAMKHQIAVPPNYTMMFKALITAEGVGKQLDPEMDLLGELEPYVKEIIKKRYSPEELSRQSLRYAGHLLRFFQQLPITSRQILNGIENGRVRFGLDDAQLEKILEQYKKLGMRKVSVAMAGIFLYLGVLTMDKGKPFLFGLPTLSWLFLVPGIFLSTRIMLNILRD